METKHISHESHGFSLKQITSDPELERHANLKLSELLEHAPPGSWVTARLHKTERGYFSSVEVFSRFKYFFAQADGVTPRSAVRRVLDKLEYGLLKWRRNNRPQCN